MVQKKGQGSYLKRLHPNKINRGSGIKIPEACRD